MLIYEYIYICIKMLLSNTWNKKKNILYFIKQYWERERERERGVINKVVYYIIKNALLK